MSRELLDSSSPCMITHKVPMERRQLHADLRVEFLQGVKQGRRSWMEAAHGAMQGHTLDAAPPWPPPSLGHPGSAAPGVQVSKAVRVHERH